MYRCRVLKSHPVQQIFAGGIDMAARSTRELGQIATEYSTRSRNTFVNINVPEDALRLRASKESC